MTSPGFIAGHSAVLHITDEHIEPDVAPAADPDVAPAADPDVAPAADDQGGTSDA